MKIVEDVAFKEVLMQRIKDREFNDRSGVHSSDLNYCLNRAAMKKLCPLPITEHEVLLFSVGWSTQHWLTDGAAETPHVVDGIIVTPDNEDYGIPWELKATYASSNKDPGENFPWLRQIMAQCHVTGQTEAKLSRFEIMGDWKWVFGNKEEKKTATHPTLHAYHLTFSPAEIRNNWNWYVARKEMFEKVMETHQCLPKMLALPMGGAYECKYCPAQYTEMCEKGEIHDS